MHQDLIELNEVHNYAWYTYVCFSWYSVPFIVFINVRLICNIQNSRKIKKTPPPSRMDNFRCQMYTRVNSYTTSSCLIETSQITKYHVIFSRIYNLSFSKIHIVSRRIEHVIEWVCLSFQCLFFKWLIECVRMDEKHKHCIKRWCVHFR